MVDFGRIICYNVNTKQKEVSNQVIFVGNYHHQLDEKGRFRIPVKFKKDFAEDSPLITRGTNLCLCMYPHDVAEKLFFKKYEDKDFDSEDENHDVRKTTFCAQWADKDGQGRIGLTPDLIEYAELTKNIVSVGVYNRVEIWSEENWQAYLDGKIVWDEKEKKYVRKSNPEEDKPAEPQE